MIANLNVMPKPAPEPITAEPPLPVVAIDFETYYDTTYSVTKLGPEAYAAHPNFNPYLVSIYGRTIQWVGPPKDAPWHLIDGWRWVSHNAAFDKAVYSSFRCTAAGVNAETALPKVWECTANLAAFLGVKRNLKDAAKILLNENMDKAPRSRMSGKHWEDLSEDLKVEMKNYALKDAQLCWYLWDTYHADWPPEERELALLSQKWGEHGVTIDLDLLQKYYDHLEQIQIDALEQIPWAITKGDTPLSYDKFAAECKAHNIEAPPSVAMTSPDAAQWEKQYGDKYPWLFAMRTYRRTNALRKKLDNIKNRVRVDQTIPSHLLYWGAHPGRWSGTGGVNLQNLPRGDLFGYSMRDLFIPRKTKVIIACDLSQIEPRVLAWLCGDTALLKTIASGISIYEAHARRTMGWEGGELKTEDPQLYALAKLRVLGLGYGCGPKKFQAIAELNGLHFSLEESQAIVWDYRNTNPLVSEFWQVQHRWLWHVATDQHIAQRDWGVELPSGRMLIYRNLMATESDIFGTVVRGNKPVKLYGGLVTENMVQAVARDAFVHNLKKLASAQLVDILWTVHDEVVGELPSPPPESLRKEVEDIMSAPIPWLPGCPLAAEAKILTKYEK